MTIQTVGFIGLGNMGGPMAAHLLDWPGGLWVHDVRAEAVAPLVDAGATPSDPATIGAGCDLVCLMVLDDEQAVSVAGELFSVARPGTVVAIHSTIRAETAERLARDGAAVGVSVLDAPVSGSTVGATEGTLAIMVGGDRAAYEMAREPLRRCGTLVTHVGGAGAGTRAKLARNLVNFVGFAAAGEAQRVADAAGIDLRTLGRIVRHSDAVTGGPGSLFVREHAVPLSADDWLRGPMAHARALGEKDLDLVVELAEALGVEVPLARLARSRLAEELGVAD